MDDQDLIGYSMYGSMKIPGLVMHDHIMGCQFHPEKSGEDGLKILEYFGKGVLNDCITCNRYIRWKTCSFVPR